MQYGRGCNNEDRPGTRGNNEDRPGKTEVIHQNGDDTQMQVQGDPVSVAQRSRSIVCLI